MRTIAIGDIHGCLRALDLLLRAIDLRAGDILVTLGDTVDRGPDARQVLDRLVELDSSVHLVPLRGNHELMMLDARDNNEALAEWRHVGGEETLASYGGSLQNVPAAHWEFIERCVDFWESPAHFFVHANAHAGLALRDQPSDMLFWRRFDFSGPHISGKTMVCGHTIQKSGLPLSIGHAICLDTGAYGGGWLSALDVSSGQVWQASQSGQERRFSLDET